MGSKHNPDFFEVIDGEAVDRKELPDVEKFTQMNKKVCLGSKGKELTDFMRLILPKMKQALNRQGFPIKTIEAFTVFVQEVQANVLKARGSYILSEKYGSFENMITKEDKPLEMIDKVIADNYEETELRVNWYIDDDHFEIHLMNNTPLNDYLENRIESAFKRSHELSEQDLVSVASDNSVLGTKASGMGLGIPMARKMCSDAKGKMYYHKNIEGWTSFVLDMPKK